VAEQGTVEASILQDYMVYLSKAKAEEDFPGIPVVEVTNREIPNAVILDEENT
jgi:hypothetical protein